MPNNRKVDDSKPNPRLDPVPPIRDLPQPKPPPPEPPQPQPPRPPQPQVESDLPEPSLPPPPQVQLLKDLYQRYDPQPYGSNYRCDSIINNLKNIGEPALEIMMQALDDENVGVVPHLP